jgi:hypothetical protein
VAELAQNADTQLPSAIKESAHDETRERLIKLALVSPQTAIIDAWRHIESRMIEVARIHKLDVAPAVWTMPMVLAALMLNKGILTEPQHSLLLKIKHLRNQVAESGTLRLSADEASRYIDLAVRLASSMK